MVSGIYQILNVSNGKRYIGSSANIPARWILHRSAIKKKTHSLKLQNALNKHGAECFSFEIIEYCAVEDLIVQEQFWIDQLDTVKNGYNTRPKADSCRGVKRNFSEEHRQRISEANKGRVAPNKGKPMSLEQKKKLSAANKGKTHNEETKKKLSASLRARNPWVKGSWCKVQKIKNPDNMKKTEEHKKKISESLKRWYQNGK